MTKSADTPKPAKKPAHRLTATEVAVTQQVWESRWFHLLMWVVFGALLLWFLDSVRGILLPFVLGAVIAYLMDPLADWLEHHHVKRGVVAAVVTIAFTALVSGVLAWLGPLLYHQLAELVTRIPTLVREVELALRDDTAPIFRALNRLTGDSDSPSSLSEVLQHGFSSVGNVASSVLASAASVLNVFGLLLITPVVCFYFIRDWEGVMKRSDELLPRAYAPAIRKHLKRINATLAAYLRGQLTVMVLLAVFYSVVFSILTLKYAVLLGVLAGLLVIIPYIGTWVSVILGMAVAYGQFGTTTPFWVLAGVYAVGQFLESQILTPKIVGDRVGVHPLWLLFGMLAGGVLLGFVGVLLAVPLTAVISVLVKIVIERYLESSLYTDK